MAQIRGEGEGRLMTRAQLPGRGMGKKETRPRVLGGGGDTYRLISPSGVESCEMRSYPLVRTDYLAQVREHATRRLSILLTSTLKPLDASETTIPIAMLQTMISTYTADVSSTDMHGTCATG